MWRQRFWIHHEGAVSASAGPAVVVELLKEAFRTSLTEPPESAHWMLEESRVTYDSPG